MCVRGLLLRRGAVVAAPLALTCRVSSFRLSTLPHQNAIAATAWWGTVWGTHRRDRDSVVRNYSRLTGHSCVTRRGRGKNFLVRALVALAPRRVHLGREAARTEADALASAREAVLFEYRALRGAHGAAAEGVRAEVAVRARRRARGAEDRREAAPGAGEGRRALLDGRGPRRHGSLPQPGEGDGRREQVARHKRCHDFEEVGRHRAIARRSTCGDASILSWGCDRHRYLYSAALCRTAINSAAMGKAEHQNSCPQEPAASELSSDESQA